MKINVNNALSNVDIIKILKDMNLLDCFGGVYCKDNLPTNLERGKFYIINLNNHNQPGSHWTTFFYNHPLDCIYFDSMGCLAPQEVHDRIKPYIYSSNDIQNYDHSTACGWFSIAFIKFLSDKQNKNVSFRSFLLLFDYNTIKNDKILYEMLYH